MEHDVTAVNILHSYVTPRILLKRVSLLPLIPTITSFMTKYSIPLVESLPFPHINQHFKMADYIQNGGLPPLHLTLTSYYLGSRLTLRGIFAG